MMFDDVLYDDALSYRPALKLFNYKLQDHVLSSEAIKRVEKAKYRESTLTKVFTGKSNAKLSRTNSKGLELHDKVENFLLS